MNDTNHTHASLETRHERLPVKIFESSRDASRHAAGEIAALIRERQSQGRACVLGLATGSSPVSVYEELVRMHREEGLSFRNVVTFNLDEYWPMEPGALQSYVRFMKEYLFEQIDIEPGNINIPDGRVPRERVNEFCAEYEAKIRRAGGVDIQILGIGRTGHIGFNEPGSPAVSRTRLIYLDSITKADAASDFYGEENVPERAITMGIGTIMEARRVILMAWGEDKANIIREAVEGPLTEGIPASNLQRHPGCSFFLDSASSAELTRVKTPWLVGECDWSDPRLVRRAVVWLCQKVEKPISKLVDRDYTDHGMHDLVAERGPAYNINIRVFNELQHTITGWPGGKPDADDSSRPERAKPFPKRVVVFSPHPDDDVISMGGTLIRLCEQGHDVHVAYQTSGNIAVFDDDAVRYTDFVNEIAETFGRGSTEAEQLYERIRDYPNHKKPAQGDPRELLLVKTLIRMGEAKSACRFVGVPEKNVHFLDMPFYQTGLVKKRKLSDKDIELCVHLLREIRPHQVYAAGDLTDPHGTHRVCLDAVTRALDAVKNEEWMKDCYVWFYRGAWQEWNLADATMAVPLAPSELQKKRRAIFKHQSQKDRPLFPGPDSREFWQRAEARNKATAALYDLLGMAEYEAMEVFKRYFVK
ncbi:MAG: glucosamine-6-phosphate deaminase [Spirochaetes bacterium]|nr:glucosamine-6-phosphate deaminase [Spirochaetota bacterium]